MIGTTLSHYRVTARFGGGELAEYRWSPLSQVLHD